ncbi:hypothetical protein C0216_30575 (plasmid) [Streptomyces globosus]|uniref:Tetratricopeptide repeat protein n=1 Tax=Streptomyces globosus TaxID=68209 RepID=A0A344UAE7_9ACTN|nr:hypothetical protein [Streptomyces globosus]AXE27868.1 hypothetical protein C0216_30575 [Streptomyces globosus]
MTSDTGIHQQVLVLLDEPADHWDRPDCDWPGQAPRHDRTDDEVALARQSANTAYVMGSLALEQGDVDRARTWFTMACDERHPGAAFRLAVLGLRQISTAPATARSQVVAGILAALCRAAEWGHSDAHRLIDPFITHTTAGNRALVVDNGAVSIVTSLPALTIDSDEPYEPQDLAYYDELLAFCIDLPAARKAASSSEPEQPPRLWFAGASTRAVRLIKATGRSFGALETPWRDMTSFEHEFLIFLAGCQLRHWPVLESRAEGAAHDALLLSAVVNPLEPYLGQAHAPWVRQCMRCESESTPRFQTAHRACRHCVIKHDRGVGTDLVALWATYWGNATGRQSHASADRRSVMEHIVGKERLTAGRTAALTGDSERGGKLTWADSVVSRLRRHRAEEALQTFWFFDTSQWAAALERRMMPRPESSASDHLPTAVFTPPPSPANDRIGLDWAELLHNSTPLSAVPPRNPQSAFHVVRDEEALYLFTATAPDAGAAPQLATPTAITALQGNCHEPSAPTAGHTNRSPAPAPRTTTTPASIQVYELCP